MDDTLCTNHFGLPLVTIIVEDWEGRNQPLVLGFLSDGTTDSFKSFLLAVREKLLIEVRAVITDRSQSQINAIAEVFPNASIVFCRVHIMCDIEQKFGLKQAVTTAFCRFFAEAITKAQILQQLDLYLAPASDKQARLIDKLLFSRDNWLPSVLKQPRMFGNETTNRVEVFFGSLKQGTNHQIQRLADIAGLVKSLAETSLAYLFHITNNVELPPEILAS
jgi:hypothetical protein